ncbi:hypothetical protein MSAN_01381400 [Mycena sanguinolenta]|uniref:Chromodomain-helicase-DNA-binding protein 1-like C-terminal domain-containing protein n=1 Tax=Mycena sanguinolenta TaxID=230812 RepID=A0A8H6Y8Q5_9AGAR|nr:hypothetical protein MSAN_01381400 [Mycena sanguinolenta]
MTQPPPTQQAIPRSFVISDRTVEYTEHRAGTARRLLHSVLSATSTSISKPPIYSHVVPMGGKSGQVLASVLHHWNTPRKALIGKVTEVLTEILKSEGRRESKNLKRKSGEAETAGDVKKPRVLIPTSFETPEPSPVASSALSGTPPSKTSMKPASSVTPASLKAPTKENPSPTPHATPVKPYNTVKPTTSPSQKRPPDPPKPVKSVSSTPHPVKQSKSISPLPDTLVGLKPPTTSLSQKRSAPKTSDDDGGPRKRQCVEFPSPSAVEEEMKSVNPVLLQLKARGMSSAEKKHSIIILGQHIERVLEQKEDGRERWQTALWNHAAQFWPKQVTGKKLEAGFKKELETSTHSPASSRSTATPAKTGPDSGKASASTPVTKPGAAESPGLKSMEIQDGRTASASHAATKTKPAVKPAVVPESPVPASKPASGLRLNDAQAPSAEPAAKPVAVTDSGAASVPEPKPATVTDVGKTKTISPTKPADAKSTVVPESRTASAQDHGATTPVPEPAATSSVMQVSRTVSRTCQAIISREVGTIESAPPPPAKPTLTQFLRTVSAPAANTAIVPAAWTTQTDRSDIEPTSTPPVAKAAEHAVTVPPAPDPALVDPWTTSVPPLPAKPTRTVSAPMTTLAVNPALTSQSALPTCKPMEQPPASAQPQTELDALLARVRNNKQILKDTQASSPGSSRAVLTAYTDATQAATSTPAIPDSVSIAALRRQYARHCEAHPERQSNDRWLAEAAASAALISILTRANEALARENAIIKEENTRLKESAKRADPNSREPSTSTLTSPTTEPAVPDGEVPSPQSQRLSVERDVVVPSEHSEYPPPPLPMEAENSRPPLDKMEEHDEGEEHQRLSVEVVPSSQSDYLLPMEGGENSRMSQDGLEEEEHLRLSVEVVPSSQSDYLLPMEGGENSRMSQDGVEEEEHQQLSVDRESDGEVVPSSQSQYLLPMGAGENSRMSQDMLEEFDVAQYERIEPSRDETFEEDTHSPVERMQCGAEQQMVVEEESTSQPETIQIKPEPTNVFLTLGIPDRAEIIDLTLDDSDDEMEETSSAAPVLTATKKIPCPLDVETTQRDPADAHGDDRDDVPKAELDESALVKSSTAGNFHIAGVDFTFTDALLLDVVSQNGRENDIRFSQAIVQTWGKILAHLQVVARKSTGYDIEINPWTETIEALRRYYDRHLAPSSTRCAHQSPLGMRNISSRGFRLRNRLMSSPSATLVDPADCKNTTRVTEIKMEESSGLDLLDLPAVSSGVRCLNRAHLLELFYFNAGLVQCNACLNDPSTTNFEFPADTLEELSAHVEDRHLQLFNHILTETAGMGHNEIGEWFKRFDALQQFDGAEGTV